MLASTGDFLILVHLYRNRHHNLYGMFSLGNQDSRASTIVGRNIYRKTETNEKTTNKNYFQFSVKKMYIAQI